MTALPIVIQNQWLALVVVAVVVVAFAVHVRLNIIGSPVSTDGHGEHSSKNPFTYPVLALGAGMLSGLFGLDGGVLLGPSLASCLFHP